MKAAADAAGRPPSSIDLVAVSKNFPAEAVLAAFAAGQQRFGENRVQEAARKFPPLREKMPGAKLHLIGTLQSNKAREAVRLADVIESRRGTDPSLSYVARLFDKGLDAMLKKVGEEATEVVMAAKDGDPGRVAAEVADVFEVPLDYLMNPAHHRHHQALMAGVERPFLSMPWTAPDARERFIWGATAGMLRNLYRFLVS